jgi:hypothetical protein
MVYWKLIFIIPIVFVLSCGSGSDDEGTISDLDEETGVVNAVVLDYSIHVDNLPLVGPQSEKLKLVIFKDRVKYNGTAEVSIGDETQFIKRASLLDSKSKDQIFINDDDSSYKIISFDKSTYFYVNDDSVEYIQIEKLDELTEIDGFSNCKKVKLRPYNRKSISGSADSTPVLKGEIWVKQDYANVEPIMRYYENQQSFFRSSDYGGLEIWRVFKQLGLPNEVILDILEAIDGLLVRGEFTCTLYSLGKKANVTISLSLTDVAVKRIPGEELRIPEGYEDKTGIDKHIMR